jgi:hypothetical protein
MGVIFLRIGDKEKQLLDEEALKLQLSLNSYCRMILINHLSTLEAMKKNKKGGKDGQ